MISSSDTAKLSTWALSARARLVLTSSRLLMSLTIVETSGWFQTHLKPHSAGARSGLATDHILSTDSGGFLVSLPPKSGLVITTFLLCMKLLKTQDTKDNLRFLTEYLTTPQTIGFLRKRRCKILPY